MVVTLSLLLSTKTPCFYFLSVLLPVSPSPSPWLIKICNKLVGPTFEPFFLISHWIYIYQRTFSPSDKLEQDSSVVLLLPQQNLVMAALAADVQKLIYCSRFSTVYLKLVLLHEEFVEIPTRYCTEVFYHWKETGGFYLSIYSKVHWVAVSRALPNIWLHSGSIHVHILMHTQGSRNIGNTVWRNLYIFK